MCRVKATEAERRPVWSLGALLPFRGWQSPSLVGVLRVVSLRVERTVVFLTGMGDTPIPTHMSFVDSEARPPSLPWCEAPQAEGPTFLPVAVAPWLSAEFRVVMWPRTATLGTVKGGLCCRRLPSLYWSLVMVSLRPTQQGMRAPLGLGPVWGALGSSFCGG